MPSKSKQKNQKKDPNIVDPKNLQVFREMDVDPQIIRIADFVDEYMKNTVRDNTVQREAVWENLRKMGYISGAMVGRAKLTGVHLVDLRACHDLAIKNGEYAFADHLQSFIDDGYFYCHIDGGNRCDTFLEFFDKTLNDKEKIKVTPAYYQFRDGQTITVNRNDVTWETLYKKDKDGDYINPEWATLGERLLNEQVCIYIYKDLNQEERADLFKILNDGINLSAAELRNREVSNICNTIRDYLNVEYKSLFVEVGLLTENESKRWGFCEFVAKLNHLWMTKSNQNMIWPGKGVLDENYKSNSAADSNFDNFVSWFEKDFVKYVKLFKSNPKWDLLSKNYWVDFFITLCIMSTQNLKLKNLDKEGRTAFMKAFKAWQTDMVADTTTGFDCGAKGNRDWSGLHSNNSNYVLSHRIKKLRKSFIQNCIDSEILVKLDSRRLFTKQQAAGFVKKQNYKTPSGKVIDVMEWSNTKVYSSDHINEWSEGNPTTPENGQLIEKKENLEKEVERKKKRATEKNTESVC